MNIRSLEAYGLHPSILDAWEERHGETLLPVQERAVAQHGVLDGRSLVVISPTSSGKTLVGEMAAAKAVSEHKRAIFLAPSKALAEEKRREFAGAYGGLGIRVACSTRDRRMNDRDILRGKFDVLVGTTEKVRSLLASAPALLSRLGVLVVDELQLISEADRGPCLEVLITDVRTRVPRCQIICLSAVLGEDRRIAEWLGADRLCVRERPVELRRGVLCDGVFRYVEHNTGREGEEDWRRVVAAGGDAQAVTLVAHFADSSEQTLVFLPTKAATVDFAKQLAERGSWGAAESAVAELDELEASSARTKLRELAPQGIAFHNADLSWAERDIVERAFRDGALMAVAATSTLSTGVNLPAKNVVLDPVRWQTLPGTNAGALVPTSKAEFENISGRAGRLHQHDDFGRAILLADSEFRRDAYMDRYVRGEFEETRSALASASDIADSVLQLCAAAPSRSTARARQVLPRTFAGAVEWATHSGRARLDLLVDDAIHECARCGLLSTPDARADEAPRLTALGQIAARHGVPVVDFAWLSECAGRVGVEGLSDLGGLLVVATAPCVRALPLTPWRGAPGEDPWAAFRTDLEQADPRARDLALDLLQAGTLPVAELRRAARRVAHLRLWLGPEATEDAEERAGAPAGSILALAEACAWLTGCLADLGDQLGWAGGSVDRLKLLARRLPLGAPESGLELAGMACPGLGRDALRSLLQHGMATRADIAAAHPDDLARILPTCVIEQLGLHSDNGAAPGRVAPSLGFRGADPDHILINGDPVRVRPAELRLAHLLAQHAGDCVPYEVIYGELWGEGGELYHNQVFVHKARLLKQIACTLSKPIADRLIVAVPGEGLRMNVPRERISFA